MQITGILFGKLIQHQLISNIPLGIAFRYVLEALRKPATSKMFKFGALALDQFKTRLQEWPQYCTFLAQIPHLRQAHPKLVEWVDKASAAADPAAAGKPVDFTVTKAVEKRYRPSLMIFVLFSLEGRGPHPCAGGSCDRLHSGDLSATVLCYTTSRYGPASRCRPCAARWRR